MSLEETEDESDRLPRWFGWTVALIVAGLCWWIALAAILSGCSSSPLSPPGPLGAARSAPIEEVLRPSAKGVFLALLGAEEPAVGNMRHLPVTSSCRPRPSVPLPYILPQVHPPRVGQEWRCRFVTSVMGPEPDAHLWLVMSTEPPAPGLPAELTPIGMNGCQLAINPQFLVHVPPGFPSDEQLPLSREPGRGRVLLRWTPPAGASGFRVWFQVLVALPNSPAGFLTSYGLEVTVGS